MMRQHSLTGVHDDVIRLAGVTKTYQARAAGASLASASAWRPGRSWPSWGPSGSGKSTLLNLVAGLDRPTAGTVTVGRAAASTRSARARWPGSAARHVGIIFQFFNLLDDLTVEDNVLLPAQLAGASRRQARGAGRRAAGPDWASGSSATPIPARLSGGAAAAGGDRAGAGELARSCCSPTSRPGRWTPPPASRSAGCCASSTRPGRRWCSSPTTPPWPQRYAARTVQLVDGQVATAAADGAGMSGLGAVAAPPRGGLLRHKVQAVVIGLVLLISTASATLGLALLAASTWPVRPCVRRPARRSGHGHGRHRAGQLCRS